MQNGQPLCPIVPLVVYHGQAAWNTPRSLDELLAVPEGLARYQVRLGFPLLDLSQWQEGKDQQEPILRSGLQVLKYGRSERLEEKLHEILEAAQGIG